MVEIVAPDSVEKFASARRDGFAVAHEIKKRGGKIVGTFCTFTPEEIFDAAGIYSVGLCGMDEEAIADAEVDLPRNLCPLVKSSYGNIITGKCPYAYFADFIVGETTCDAKKKMYEMLSKHKEMYVLHLPQGLDREYALKIWTAELRKFISYIEEKLSMDITDDMLRKAAARRNELRLAKLNFMKLQTQTPPPRFGWDMYFVTDGEPLGCSVSELTANINGLAKTIQAEYDAGVHPVPLANKRILITGCPIGGTFGKVVPIIEQNGGVVVCFENCGGIKPILANVDTEADDIVAAIAERYLQIGCAVLTPNEKRLQLLPELIEEFKIDGVIEMDLQVCLPYIIESQSVRGLCKQLGVPYTQIETTYSQTDIGQLTTRLSAFLEML